MFLYWLIDNNYNLKIIHLTASKNVTDCRAKKRNTWWDKTRTEKRTLKHTNEMNNLLNDDKIKKYVVNLPNVNDTDLKKNLDILDALMT